MRTRLGRLLARTPLEYGLYVVDRGGEGVSIVVEDRPDARSLRQPGADEKHDVAAIVSALGWVR